MPDAVELSIIIKAWNEQARIAACLRSVLSETAHLACQVIVADSLSGDRTVAIAARQPVDIVQLARAADRGCGAALQLGYQFARGRYIYVLDADMTLEAGFLGRAIAYLEAHPDVAGVGGRLLDAHVRNAADRQRVARYGALRAERGVAALGGGGLYRRSAIEQVGYLAHRWLPACEEAELGARLAWAGWRLVRLPHAAVTHCGHSETSGQMLRRLWRNRRMQAYGMFLRSAARRPWLAAALRACWFVFLAPALHLAALLAAALASRAGLAPFLALWGAAALVACTAAGAALAWRRHSWPEGLLALLAWHLYALAAARGMLRPLGDPRAPIAARVLRRGRRHHVASPTGK